MDIFFDLLYATGHAGNRLAAVPAIDPDEHHRLWWDLSTEIGAKVGALLTVANRVPLSSATFGTFHRHTAPIVIVGPRWTQRHRRTTVFAGIVASNLPTNFWPPPFGVNSGHSELQSSVSSPPSSPPSSTLPNRTLARPDWPPTSVVAVGLSWISDRIPASHSSHFLLPRHVDPDHQPALKCHRSPGTSQDHNRRRRVSSRFDFGQLRPPFATPSS